jgi:aspartyl/asparaginyl beta-hydroxylase (cupin superfamily)
MANWIDEIPHSERKKLFDQQLRNSFLNNYDLTNSSKFFDIYKCKKVRWLKS